MHTRRRGESSRKKVSNVSADRKKFPKLLGRFFTLLFFLPIVDLESGSATGKTCWCLNSKAIADPDTQVSSLRLGRESSYELENETAETDYFSRFLGIAKKLDRFPRNAHTTPSKKTREKSLVLLIWEKRIIGTLTRWGPVRKWMSGLLFAVEMREQARDGRCLWGGGRGRKGRVVVGVVMVVMTRIAQLVVTSTRQTWNQRSGRLLLWETLTFDD